MPFTAEKSAACYVTFLEVLLVDEQNF